MSCYWAFEEIFGILLPCNLSCLSQAGYCLTRPVIKLDVNNNTPSSNGHVSHVVRPEKAKAQISYMKFSNCLLFLLLIKMPSVSKHALLASRGVRYVPFTGKKASAQLTDTGTTAVAPL